MSRRGFSVEFERGSNMRRGLMVLCLGVAVVALWVLAFQHTYADPPASGTHYTPPPMPPTPPVVTVLGDSFSGGSDMNRGPTWPMILARRGGWDLGMDAIGGSGYIASGPMGPPFPQRIAELASSYDSDLIILAGGLNDEAALLYGHQSDSAVLAEIRQAATDTVEKAKAKSPQSDILMLSPFANGNSRPTLDAITGTLRSVAAHERIKFLDVTDFLAGDRAELIGSDGTHPVDAGHHLLAKEIGAALKRMGLPDASAYPDPPA